MPILGTNQIHIYEVDDVTKLAGSQYFFHWKVHFKKNSYRYHSDIIYPEVGKAFTREALLLK